MLKIAEGVTVILLSALLGFVVSPVARDLWAFGADKFLPTLSRPGQLSLVATLAILCLVEFAFLYRLMARRFLLRQYEEHPERPGAYRHKRTKQPVCGVCLHKGIVSPLAVDGRNGLGCIPCECIFYTKEEGHQ